jgi:hypothetical protein
VASEVRFREEQHPRHAALPRRATAVRPPYKARAPGRSGRRRPRASPGTAADRPHSHARRRAIRCRTGDPSRWGPVSAGAAYRQAPRREPGEDHRRSPPRRGCASIAIGRERSSPAPASHGQAEGAGVTIAADVIRDHGRPATGEGKGVLSPRQRVERDLVPAPLGRDLQVAESAPVEEPLHASVARKREKPPSAPKARGLHRVRPAEDPDPAGRLGKCVGNHHVRRESPEVKTNRV